MRRFLKFSNVFYKFLASYILILIVPIIIFGSIYYIKSLQAVTDGMSKNHRTMLQQAIQTIDFRSRETDKLVDQVLSNSRIIKMVNSTALMNASKRLDILDITNDLKMYMAGNSFIDNIAIYLSGYDIIITANAMYSSNDFFNRVYPSTEISSEEWLELLKNKDTLMKIMNISDGNRENDMHVIMKNIHMNARLIIFTDLVKYTDIFDNLVHASNGFYYVTSQNGDLFITNDTDKDYIHYLDSTTNGNGISSNNDMIVISGATIYGGFKCSLLVPQKTYTIEIEKIKTYTVFLIILCLVLGIGLSLIMAKRNYIPIKKIIGKIKTIGSWNSTGFNEYETIERLIESSLKEVSILKEALISQPPVLGTEQAVQLSNCLKSGNRNLLEQLLDSIYRETIGEKDPKSEKIRRLSFDVCNIVLRTVGEIGIDIHETLPVDELLLKNDINDTFIKIREKTCDICEFIICEKKNSRVIGEVLTFIDSHISDCNLSLEAIAVQFDKSGKYLSKIFKDETNCNFLDYVNNKRVELAKEYLKHHDISYAYSKSGFSSMSTFMRVFKKYAGVTPGMYMDISQQQGNLGIK